MRITLTQQLDELAIGATAVLRVDLAATGAPPMNDAELLGVTGGAFAEVTLGPGLALTAGVLDLAGGGSGYVLPAASSKLRGGVVVGANITLAGDAISLTGANVQAALGLVPVDSKGAAAAAPVQSVAGLVGAVAVPFAIAVDFSQGAVPAPGTITLDPKLPAALTITAADHTVGTAGGSVSFRVQLVTGGTPASVVGLDAVTSTSSSITTTKATSANKGAIADAMQLVITGVTGTPAGAHITIRGTTP